MITLAVFVALATTTDGFFTIRNLRNILDQQPTILIAASFMTLAIIAGSFDVSVSSVCVAAPLFALSVENATGSAGLAMVTALVVGLVTGAMDAALAQAGTKLAETDSVMVGTTRFVNALVERRHLARTGLTSDSSPKFSAHMRKAGNSSNSWRSGNSSGF